jgi:hypothetical protein
VLGRIERLGAPHAHPSESDSVQLPPLQCLIFHCAHIQSIDARYACIIIFILQVNSVALIYRFSSKCN